MAPQRVQGTAVGPRRVSLEARDPGPQRLGYRRDFHSLLLVILSAQISPSTFKSLHTADKKHVFLEKKVQFKSVVKIQQLVEIKFAHFRVIVGQLGYILEG